MLESTANLVDNSKPLVDIDSTRDESELVSKNIEFSYN